MRRGLVALVLALLVLAPAGALAADDLPPPPPGAPAQVGSPPLYDRFDAAAYTLDADVNWTDPALRSYILLLNQLLTFKAWVVKLAIRATEYALIGNPWPALDLPARQVQDALATHLWHEGGAPLVVAALAVAGLGALLTHLTGRGPAALRTLLGTTAVLTAAYALLAAAPDTLAGLTAGSRAIAVQVAGTVAAATGHGSTAGLAERAGTAAWRALVHDPWAAHEFTDGAAAARYALGDVPGARLLQMRPSQRWLEYIQRPSEAERQATFAPWREDQAARRMLMATWTLLAGLAFSLPVLLLAGGVLARQVLLAALAALLPVWLLLALWWPGGGLSVLRRVLTATLGALVLQAVLAATLATVLVLGTTTATALASLGWPAQALALATVALVGLRWRYAWVPLPVAAFPAPRTPGEAALHLHRRTSLRHMFATAPAHDSAAAVEFAHLVLPGPTWQAVEAETPVSPTPTGWQEEFTRSMRELRLRLGLPEPPAWPPAGPVAPRPPGAWAPEPAPAGVPTPAGSAQVSGGRSPASRPSAPPVKNLAELLPRQRPRA